MAFAYYKSLIAEKNHTLPAPMVFMVFMVFMVLFRHIHPREYWTFTLSGVCMNLFAIACLEAINSERQRKEVKCKISHSYFTQQRMLIHYF